MTGDWRPFVELVQRHHRFLLTTHVRPDGDGLGSCKALAVALRQLGKQVRVAVPGHVPDRYDFLDPEGDFRSFETLGPEDRAADALVVLDTGTWNQLAGMADFVRQSPAEKAVIDHHVTQDGIADLCLVDTSAEATGRLVFEAVRALGVPPTPAVATPLFVALAMDTGWFRHGNTSAATLALAAELVAAGARPDRLYQELYERNTLGRMKLMGLVLERLTRSADGLVAHSAILAGDYVATGAIPPDSEDLVNFTLALKGVAVGLLFMEQPRGGIKVSFRSRGQINIGRVAEQFGGGGHVNAAGAIVTAPLEEVQARVLGAVRDVLADGA